MKSTHRFPLAVPVLVMLIILAAGCGDRDPASLPAAVGNVDPLVFDDALSDDVYFQAFFQTHITTMTTDSVFAYGGGLNLDGARSLKFNVPPEGSSLGLYTGGVITAASGRDLADFNALTFYARANQPLTVDVFGFGNDNTGTSRFEAGRANVAIDRDWSFIIVPIPDSSRLRSERGLLTVAEAIDPALPDGYDFWVDEVRFAKLGNIEIFRASMRSGNKMTFVGANLAIESTNTVFLVDGSYMPVNHMPGYFDFTTSNPAVAVVEGGAIRVVGVGDATINGTLGELPVQGTVNVTGYQPPTAAAPAPTLPASDVISMFSDVYVDRPVETWRASWGGSTTQYEEYLVAGDPTKLYSDLNFVGIEFTSVPINASEMTHFHLDVYAPEGTNFKVKFVSFPNPAPAPGVETPDLVLDASSDPAFTSGDWVSLDIPLASFTTPDGFDWSQLGQLVFSTNDSRLVLVDNIYFHK